jgi:hypothetical protein
MFDMEEQELCKLNQTIKDMPKPDTINEYIRKGMSIGIKKKRLNKIRRFSNIAAILLLAVFITSVRTMPVFAERISNIPGLEYLVDLINFDKGLNSAVENNFIEHINSSETYEGLTFTIKDVILDSSKGIVFYTIESEGDHHYVNLEQMKFTDEYGKDLQAAVSHDFFIDKDLAVEKLLSGKVELDFNKETVLPDTINIEVTIRESKTTQSGPKENYEVLSPTWKFQLPVDKEKIKSLQKTYVLNQSIEVEGQKIQFKQVTITPTRITVDIKYDKNNTKKIFHYDDIKLIDEKGEAWGTITNGMLGSRIDENYETLNFQSNYFAAPKELYITGSSIRAVDKDKCTVEVDLENNKLLKAPDEKLKLTSIDTSLPRAVLNFTLEVDDPMDEKRTFQVFDFYIKDSLGNTYESNTSGSTSSVNGFQQSTLTLNKALKPKGVLYLTINDYPARINGDFKVRVK